MGNDELELRGGEGPAGENRNGPVTVDLGRHVDVVAVPGRDELAGRSARPEGGFDVNGRLVPVRGGGRLTTTGCPPVPYPCSTNHPPTSAALRRDAATTVTVSGTAPAAMVDPLGEGRDQRWRDRGRAQDGGDQRCPASFLCLFWWSGPASIR